MSEQCGIIAPRRPGMPADEHGCVKPHGHHGCHEYEADDGLTVQWETDMTCDCHDCHSSEPENRCVLWTRALRED